MKKLATLATFDRSAPGVPAYCLEAVDVRVHHLLVAVEAEDQRDVDVAALGDHLADRGDAGGGAGDLDHQVRAGDLLVQRARRGLGAGAVVGQAGIDLDAHEAVAAVALRGTAARSRSSAPLMSRSTIAQ